MTSPQRSALALTAVIVLACAPPAPRATAPSPSPSRSPASALELRQPGTLTASIRVEAPPAGRAPQDPAHSQKRAFEAAVATTLAQRIIGAAARTELRGSGRERLTLVTSREADVAMTLLTPEAQGVRFSVPFAAGGAVLATVNEQVRTPRDLAGKIVAATPGDTDAGETAERYFKEQSIDAKVQMFPNPAAAFDAVAAGQAAAVATDRTSVALLQQERTGIRTIAEISRRPYVVAVRADATTLLSRVDETLRALIASGEIRDLARRAGFPYEAP